MESPGIAPRLQNALDMLLVLHDVLVVLGELIVEQGEAPRHRLRLASQVADHVVVRQFVQVEDHLLGVGDEISDQLGVQFGVLDLLLVVGLHSELVVLCDGTLADDVVRLACEGLEILLRIYLLRIMQVFHVDQTHLVNDVLVGELVATVGRDEQVRIVVR